MFQSVSKGLSLFLKSHRPGGERLFPRGSSPLLTPGPNHTATQRHPKERWVRLPHLQRGSRSISPGKLMEEDREANASSAMEIRLWVRDGRQRRRS